MRLTTAALLFVAVPAMAQDPQTRTWWGFIALGPGGAADSGFYATGIGGGIQRGRKLYMARVASLDTPNRKRIQDAGILVGVARRPHRLHTGFAAGIGVATDSRDSTALAMPIESHVTWIITPRVAVGGRVFGSVNRLTNFSGLSVTLQLGRLRAP